VIQLNIIHAINAILEALQNELDSAPGPARIDIDGVDQQPIPSTSTSKITLTDKHRLFKLSLGPLRRIEIDLRRRLGAAVEEDNGFGAQAMYATPFDGPSSAPNLSGEASSSTAGSNSNVNPNFRRRRIGAGAGEVVVRSWKSFLQADADRLPPSSGSLSPRGARGDKLTVGDTVDEATEVIAKCKDDLKALWEDTLVQQVLVERKVKMADSAGL
jgi:guanine nucleotide-binding protein subunit alpha